MNGTQYWGTIFDGTRRIPWAEPETTPEHTRDEDCTVDRETACCTVCGVDHSDECPDCGGRGFHRHRCAP